MLLDENKKKSTLLSILKSNEGKEKLIEYFDIDSLKGKGFFTTDGSYENFKEFFTPTFNKLAIDQIKDDAQKEKDDAQKEKDDAQKEKEIKDEINIKEIKKLDLRKKEFNEVKKIFSKHSDLTNLLNDLNKSEEDWVDINIIDNEKDPDVKKDLLKKANIDFDKTKKILQDQEVEILDVLFKEANQTGNYDDVKIVVQKFKNLEIIDQTRYDELQEIIIGTTYQKKDDGKPVISSDPLTPGYTSRGDTLYKKTDEANFTIRDGKITSVSKESGFKLVDYSTLDEEGKAFIEKTKFQSQIEELNVDLLDNKSKKEVLDQINRITQNKDINSITEEDIDIIILDVINKIPLLKYTVEKIKLSKEASSKKLEYIIKLLYGNITGTTNTTEINSKQLTYMIFTCNQKLEDSDNEINKKLEKAKREIELITEQFPNLEEKSIQERIKSQETRMQDTIKFCDDYGLSALGHIAYIKKVIIEFNKKEVDNQIPIDIGTGTDFMLKDNLPIYRKHMAKLLGRKEDQIYRTDEKGLLDYDKTNQELTNKDYLEKLLKERGVLNKKTGELNIYKVQELLEEGDTPELNEEDNKK